VLESTTAIPFIHKAQPRMTGTDVVHHLSAALFVPVLSGFERR